MESMTSQQKTPSEILIVESMNLPKNHQKLLTKPTVSRWLSLLPTSKLDSSINQISIAPIPSKYDAHGIFIRSLKEIVVGVATDEPKWTEVLRRAPIRNVVLGQFMVLTHEVGHAILGSEEHIANGFMIYCLETLYKRKLPWPHEINYTNLVAMTIREKMI